MTKNSVVIGRKDANNEVCLRCGASRTALREMIASGGRGNLSIVEVITGNCPSCKKALGGSM